MVHNTSDLLLPGFSKVLLPDMLGLFENAV